MGFSSIGRFNFALLCSMNRINRLIIQSALWFVVGLIIWLSQDANLEILHENLVVFVFQIILIGTLIYLVAPILVNKRNYILFGLISFVSVVLITFFLNEFLALSLEPHRPIVNDMEMGPRPPHRPPPEQRRPPSQFLFHLLILGFTYILALAVEVFSHLKKKEEETIKAKNVNLQNELELLKSQINPHFLFNSLNNIYTLAGIDTNKTQKSIINLSDMLRYVLYECNQDTVPISKEIEYIENYLRLFALKSSQDYPISNEFNITNNSIPVAPMLFIPFVENAIKHSNIDDRNNSFINIKMNADSNSINFEIENSKPQNEMIKDNVGGIGLENVRKRLTILYPEKHDLRVVETDSSFKVKLHLELL